MSETNFQLPNECWELVFTFLNHQNHNLKPLSLVSKQFLFITNNLQSSLTISDQTLPHLPLLFSRFPKLQSLTLTRFSGDLHALLNQISQSSLSINSLHIRSCTTISADGFRVFGKKMKTLKSLTCSSVDSPTVSDLLLISECLPFLEELEIGSFRLKYSNKRRLI